jgi:hypothetical protein
MNNKELEVIIKQLASKYEWDVEFINGGSFEVAYDAVNDVVFGNYCGVIDFSKITDIACRNNCVDFLYNGRICSFRASRKSNFDFKHQETVMALLGDCIF